MNATPAKLRDGTWGARVTGTPSVGDLVTITTKAGKTWDARVNRVIWTDGKVALCATVSTDRPSSPRDRNPSNHNCPRCCRTATRTAQIFEDCEYCGAEPIYV